MNADAISRKVLFVDDEPMMLEGIRRQLRGRFAVTTAVGGEAGLAVLREQGPFAVVVSDYRMLGMDGVEFLRHVRELSPEVVRVMLTGQAELDVAVNALHEGCIFRFLSKPCSRETLTAVLDDCLEQHRLAVSEKLLRRELDAANQELRKLNQNLENLVARRTATIENLYLLVSELNGLDSLEEVVHSIVLRTADTLRSRRAALLLPDASGEYLCMRAAVGIDAVIRGQVRMPIGAPLAGRVYQKGECVVVND
nr:response regulator [Phycisphaerae bacterium]